MAVRRPLIGFATLSNVMVPGSATPKFANNESYARAVCEHGGAPVMIPSLAEPAALLSVYEALDGLLLSGGPDIDPVAFYGEQPHEKLGVVDHAMDKTERWLIGRALADDMPILGICRGLQILNAVAGGSLYQDIETQYGDDLTHIQIGRLRHEPAHDVILKAESRLTSVLGGGVPLAQIPVNTFHHQAVKDLAPEYVSNAHAEDGTIEGIERPHSPFVMAVQCHPEELYAHDAHWSRLFDAFISAAATYHAARNTRS